MLYPKMAKVNVVALLLITFFASVLFVNKAKAQDADECDPIELTVIARDAHGDFIPGISFQVLRQVEDVDGNPKPDKQVASGVIDKNLGRKTVTFKDTHGLYALKMWDIDKNITRFYYYNDIYAGCGEEVEVEETLSSIRVTLRNTDRELRKNTNLSIYTQRYDADHEPIKEKNDLVANLNTSEEGEVLVYVPESDTSIDGKGTDYYVMEVKGEDGLMFTEYNIHVSSGGERDLNYIFSKLELKLRDANEVSFPAGTMIEVFKQDVDDNYDYIIGEKQKDITTDDNGIATLECPEDVYVARVMGADGKYQYFWDLYVEENNTSSYDLYTEEEWDPGAGACEAESTVTVITRDVQGVNIPKLKFEIYEQTTDVDGVPKVGSKVLNSVIDEYGKGVVTFNPDPRKKYALKIYENNSNVGEYWFFNAMQLECRENIEIEKKLPAINFVLRDGNGELYTNQKFSLYTQKYDVDGKPIKEKKDLVSSGLVTSEKGLKTVYVASDHPYDKEKRGTYVLEAAKNDGKDVFREYDIVVPYDEDVDFEYVFSDIALEIVNAGGEAIVEKQVEFYEQERNANGDYELGKLLKSKKTDQNGLLEIEYPSGYYAVSIKDDVGGKNIFWNTQIRNRTHNEKTLATNLTRIRVNDIEGNPREKGTVVKIYSMIEDENGYYYQNKKIKEITVKATGYAQAVLSPGPYLFTSKNNKVEYGKALYTENGKLQIVTINSNNDDKLATGQRYKLTKPATSASLADKLSGKILLQVEERGEAWYVDTKTKLRYYMKDGTTAYNMMRKFGLGITTVDLEKIPIGLDERFEEYDYDGDMVFDKMEEALGTDMYNYDSDEDGYDDGVEALSGYDPLGPGRMNIDWNFANKLKGKILLQVESRGEAWYINPADGRRYYMQDGESAYEIMRFLSLGITNSDLEQIAVGSVGE